MRTLPASPLRATALPGGFLPLAIPQSCATVPHRPVKFLLIFPLVLVVHAFAADSIPVTNPSFQADNFPVYPGYRGGGNPAAITGWGGNGGINGSDLGAGTPFADNGAVPDGTRVAFIQGAGSLMQTLSGFTVGQRYWVQMWMNARGCCGDVPKVNVTLGGQQLLAPTQLSPVGGTSPYYLANFAWTATSTFAQLSINVAAAAGGDASAVFDAVAVIKRGTGEIVLANPSFEASGSGLVSPGYSANIAGWSAIGSGGQTGINTASGTFLDNGLVPDGSNVLFLQNTNAAQPIGVQQSVAGLVPGQTYRLTLRYNSRTAGDDARLRVSIDGLTAFDAIVPPVGAGQPFSTLTFDFTAGNETALLKIENAGNGTDSTALVDNVSLATFGPAVTPPLALPTPGAPGSSGGLVTFNEIHYHPAGASAPEWVEIVNQCAVRLDLSGWQLAGGIAFTFPDGTFIEPGAFLVVSGLAGNPAGALGPFTGHLGNSGETVRLLTRQGWEIDSVSYGVSGEWPTAPDGTGPTLSKRAVSFASDAAASWVASTQGGGTPGAANFSTPPALATPAAHVAGSIVLNEIFYHARPTYADPLNAVAYAESAAEWIELYNRTGVPVDISGWQLAAGVSYIFPAGTTLAGGAFLVVNQTQFSGTLSNSGDAVEIRDGGGMLVDRVRYHSRGRWSGYADGAGASLELIDPNADNTKPESWAASDESAKMAWQNFSYTALGAEPPGSNNPGDWHEFLLGLLDAGEVLIDDISVREDPAGANVQVIQNGTFEGDTIGQPPLKWRCLGTHKNSVVVQDPTGPGKVLKVVATDGLEHTYNNCSTTLTGNRVIDPTKNYAISFRAKWRAGSPQLNTRLYLDRAARTTILPQPAIAGTPGAVNSRHVANAGPTFSDFIHTPLVPALGQAVTVFARPFDPDGLGPQTLFYAVNGGAFQSVAMTNDGTGRFSASIPGQPMTGVIVQFYVQGADALGATATFPSGGANSRALYKVGDGGVNAQPIANKIRFLMTAADAVAMHTPIHSVSDARFGATVIANDREIFYDVHVRLRSSPYGRQGNRTGWNFDFDPEQPFRGTETDLVLDGSFVMPRGDGNGYLEVSLGPTINEMLYQRIAEHAGGIPSEIADVAFVATPYYENRACQIRLRRYGNTTLDNFTPGGSNGSLFKQEIIYYPQSTVDGNPESLKNAYSTYLAVDILSQGTAKDAYRFNYLVQNHAARDDFTGIMGMCSAFSGSNANLYTASDAALDLESWTRTLALNALTGLADTYNQYLPHNIQFLARPSDGRVMLLPWDMDHAFYYATNFGLYGGDAHRVKDLIADPRVKRRMAGHLLDLCNTSFNNTYLDPWIDHYNAIAARTYNANFKNWVSARRTFVLAQLNTDWPATPFAITTNGGANFSVNAPTATLQGSAWIDVHHIRKAGAVEPLDLVWLGGNSWQVVVPVGAGANVVTLQAFNHADVLVGSASITITNTGPNVPAAAGNLVISEIMYHPANPSAAEVQAGFTSADDFEFIELMNVGANPVDLTGAAFTAGIAFTFAGGTLAPGARLLLVRNAAAFALRYGALPTAGVYTGALGNTGDHLLLLDRGGVTILDFSYADASPWPAEADGAGYSLTLVRPGPLSNLGLASSWRVSAVIGGSPGASDALLAANFPTLLAYALAQQPAVTIENGYATLTWRERIGADDATITPQLSSDLAAWNADPGDQSLLVPLIGLVNPDGTRTVRVRAAAPASSTPRTVFRLRVQSP